MRQARTKLMYFPSCKIPFLYQNIAGGVGDLPQWQSSCLVLTGKALSPVLGPEKREKKTCQKHRTVQPAKYKNTKQLDRTKTRQHNQNKDKLTHNARRNDLDGKTHCSKITKKQKKAQ